MRGSIRKIIALLEVSQLDEGLIGEVGLVEPARSGIAPHTYSTIKRILSFFFF